jgi:hypothetical protein
LPAGARTPTAAIFAPVRRQLRRTPFPRLSAPASWRLLELSKLNFNNTQFDSGDPITVRAARRVGDILKHVPAGKKIESRFRYFT